MRINELMYIVGCKSHGKWLDEGANNESCYISITNSSVLSEVADQTLGCKTKCSSIKMCYLRWQIKP